MGRCSSCGAPVFWAITVNRKRIPIDEVPVDDGNIEITVDPKGRRLASVIPPLFLSTPIPAIAGHVRYKSHFATCPNAAHHRKDRS